MEPRIALATTRSAGWTRAMLLRTWGGLQQLLHLLLPVLREKSSAMANGVFARRNQKQTRVLHALELSLHDARFGRIALVIGRVDRQQCSLNALQSRRWV